MKYGFISLFIFLQIFLFGCTPSERHTGLLIIAHGSSSPEWNRTVTDLADQVSALLREKGNRAFKVEVAFLEKSPLIADKISLFQKQGVEEVYVQPLFFVPSGHLSRDIPSALDMYYEKELSAGLKREGILTAKSKIHLTMGPPLSYGNLVGEVMLSRTEKMSRNPSDEKLIFLSHGSGLYHGHWEKMIRDAGGYVCEKKGIKSFDYAFVKVGQDFVSHGLPVIRKGLAEGKRLLVAGIFLAQGAKGILDSSAGNRKLRNEIESLILSGRVVFSETGLLPDRRVADWIVQRTLEYGDRFK